MKRPGGDPLPKVLAQEQPPPRRDTWHYSSQQVETAQLLQRDEAGKC